MFLRLHMPMLAAIVVGAMCGCRQRAVVPPPDTPSPYPELGIAASNYPKIDGSTSAEPLQVLLACKVLGAHYVWTHAESDDTRRLMASDEFNMIADHETYGGEKRPLCRYINSVIRHQGTNKAYVNLISRRVDMILVARSPSKDELRLASRKEVTLDIEPVALDAFVFLLNNANPVDSLTLEQIRDTYSGRTVNWQQVGGKDAPIKPYQRNRNSGSQEVMRAAVMQERKMINATEMLTGSMMGYPFLAVDDDPSGIGYSFHYYQEFMAPERAVKTCAVDGVKPTPETISSRRYPLVTDVYVVLRQDTGTSHPTKKLRDWLLTPTGQQMVQECGYVSIDSSIAEDYDVRPRDRFGPQFDAAL